VPNGYGISIKLPSVLQPDPTKGKATPTFDLSSPGLALILDAAMAHLDADDLRARHQMIEEGVESGRARYTGLDESSGFAIFTWGGKTLVMINPSILPPCRDHE
jgi:hypothetical protein